jgi:hypothetical protein
MPNDKFLLMINDDGSVDVFDIAIRLLAVE